MKTEDLKALGLNDDQVQKVFAMNGAEMNDLKQQVATLTTERDTARTHLGEANKKLEGYDPEWRSKAEKAENDAKAQVAELQHDFAAERAVSGVQFSSDSAKRAFLSDLKAKKLPLQEGKLLGFDDYLKSYKESDPGAFAPEKAAPTVTVGGKGQAPASSNQSFLDNKYKNNPFYHPKGE
ncbi:phage scaffolding protein [Gemmiger formicilis]|uniref:phage scaffolding protein n=1 Tax=Gemmiger formicilis TaxID=745368 RepID=UPI00195B7610|nr:phage scaffolding protein [Gemmiger formicilis]MBM6715633.1 phage scaffolding protein [Gemmiger formicilis]